MLNYSIKISSDTNTISEIPYESLLLSEDLEYMSGTIDNKYGLIDGQEIFISSNGSTKYLSNYVYIKTHVRQGYVVYENKQYNIQQFKQVNTTVNGITFADGKKYAINEFEGNYSLTIKSHMIPSSMPGIQPLFNDVNEATINIKKNQFNKFPTSITIPTRYYLEDNYIVIDNVAYYVDLELDDLYITLKNSKDILPVIVDYKTIDGNDIIKTYMVDYFKILKRPNMHINIEHAMAVKPIQYILFPYNPDDGSVGKTVKLYLRKYNEKLEGHTIYYIDGLYEDKQGRPFKIGPYYGGNEETLKYIKGLSDNSKFKTDIRFYYDDTIDIESLYVIFAKTYENFNTKLYDEWEQDDKGEHIQLFLDGSNYHFETSQIIDAESSTSISSTYEINATILDNKLRKYIIYDGQVHYSEIEPDVFITYNDDDKLFTKVDNIENSIYIYGYIEISDNDIVMLKYKKGENIAYPLNATINDTKVSGGTVVGGNATETPNKTYPRYERNFFILNGIKRYYDNKDRQMLINEYKKYRLVIEQMEGINSATCSVLGYNPHANMIISNIVNNQTNFIFKLFNPLFDPSAIEVYPYSDTLFEDNKYTLYAPNNYLQIPLTLSADVLTNLHQEFLLNKAVNYANINRIIDMEKDIYYPAYQNKEGKFALVNDIFIDLHFRSRDLSTWTINEDVYSGMDKHFSKIKENEDGETISSSDIQCNWNILDYYDIQRDKNNISVNDYFGLKPILIIEDNENSSLKYYQPSDLLYFLNFTNDDIFYQKSKVGKSFIRLSFYDSPNQFNQSLLHSATVFMNEGNLYKKYINNTNNKSDYITVNKALKTSQVIQKNTIGVNCEPCTYEVNDNISYTVVTNNEDKRLSSGFHITNMFESLESSEGFYLYMFKEFSNGLHEAIIYLKVEFNHAGTGRVINFMQPFKTNNGDKEMLDLTREDDIKSLKNGCPINQLYEYLYIPIHVNYDFDNKKFVYYLPQWLTEHNPDKESAIRLNLYELKIKDDSNIFEAANKLK